MREACFCVCECHRSEGQAQLASDPHDCCDEPKRQFKPFDHAELDRVLRNLPRFRNLSHMPPTSRWYR